MAGTVITMAGNMAYMIKKVTIIKKRFDKFPKKVYKGTLLTFNTFLSKMG